MPAIVCFHQLAADLPNGVHNFGAHQLKIALTNVAPSQSADAVLGDITEITAENGYSAGGAVVTVTSSSQSGGTYRLIVVDPLILASGGSFGPARYTVLYNNTPSSPNKPLIGYWDKGDSVAVTNGNSWIIDASSVLGILTFSV